MTHSKQFRKTVSNITPNPFLQVVEHTGNEHAYKPTPHGNAKDETNEYQHTATWLS